MEVPLQLREINETLHSCGWKLNVKENKFILQRLIFPSKLSYLIHQIPPRQRICVVVDNKDGGK